mgnify:CR=1 FL=1
MSCCGDENQGHEHDGCCEDEKCSAFIDPKKVGEISVGEDGVVVLEILNDKGGIEQELALEFQSESEAMDWLKETFGDLLEEKK